MVDAKVNGDASITDLDPVSNNAANLGETETTASGPMKNAEELSLVSEIKDKEENVLEVKKQEITVVVIGNQIDDIEEKNELNAVEAEEENEETASGEGEEEEEEEAEAEEEEGEGEEEEEEEEGEGNGVGEAQNEENVVGEGEDEEKAEEEKNKKKIEVDSKKRTIKPIWSRKNKMARRGPEEENHEKAIAEEENEEREGGESNEKKIEVDSRKKTRRPRRGRNKKVAERDPEKVISKGKDKPESSGKKMASEKAESMGMIFMCNSKTKKDCYHYKVLGLPAGKKDTVQKIYKGMRLFLFDIDLRLMYGIYKAAEPGGYNIEPKAFKSAFPSQVRFKVLEDCLPLAEEKFKRVIKDNYYAKNKFDCLLNSEQVKNLCKLFLDASKGPKSKRPGRSLREERRTFADRDRIGKRARGEERHAALVRDVRYHERPVIYEREGFASQVEPLVRVQHLHQPVPAPSYTYVSQVAPLTRVQPLPPPVSAQSYTYGRTLDAYGWDPLFQHRDRQHLEMDLRHHGEPERHDPYISYRDPVYSANLPPEYHPAAGSTSEYRPAAGLPPVYSQHQPFYRY